MATRRPASSRARINSTANNTTIPRSRSAMSKPLQVTQLDDGIPSKENAVAANSKHNQSASIQENTETNIQVVIRCRRRSEREIEDNSPSIVTAVGAKSKELSIELSAPLSSLGIVTLPPVRTYPFDLVFGPEADQAMIYHEVVAPMLEEVLMGYNCTLFAYGQTGTGKTYTMQGNLVPSPMGNPSTDAGVIPRVLFRLFHQLETSNSDYSVKVSFIELYNEELRDLLTNDFSAPGGTTQPMGLGGKDVNKVSDNGLKMFDDATKRGVTIQGLEEIAVKDSQAALALLSKGSHRRQIAATKFNDHSSRSHSVFSITVHVKEPSIAGEELLKIGKLNLVDLAGSENIGRSGAENKRAREAGMINQSLLTLGRVINALVDKASHIPYRESKLTRLLQDSLGGRTKTCIIATISPARSNMEETLSTLDYAIRAKSIRNKPELNQRTTRNSLLKDYVAEIERLKADLIAAREKNGIYFSEETWTQLTKEHELRQTELQEAKKQVDIIEGRMRGVREEFDQSIGLLKTRERELKDAQQRLHEARTSLERTEAELVLAKTALEEEVVVRQSHQQTEISLNQVARELKKVAQLGVKNIESLFEKLERKNAVLRSNSHIVLTQGPIITSASNVLTQKLNEFADSSSHSILKIKEETKHFQLKELESLAATSARLDGQLQSLQDALEDIGAKDDLTSESLSTVQNIVKEMHKSFTLGFTAWSEALTRQCEKACTILGSTGLEAFDSVSAVIKTVSALVDAVVDDARSFIDAERQSIAQTKALAVDVSQKEIARLKKQNVSLAKIVDLERSKGNKAKDELIQRVSELLGDFTAERDRSLRTAVASVEEENLQGDERLKAFESRHQSIVDQLETNNVEMVKTLQKQRSETKRTRDGAYKSLSIAKSELNNQVEELTNYVSGSVTSYATQAQKQADAMSLSCTNSFEQHSRAKRARIEATASLSSNVQSEYHLLRKDITSRMYSIQAVTEQVHSKASELASVVESYHASAATDLEHLRSASEALSEGGARDDIPTGSTPRKRAWDYADTWDLTKPRDVILKAWRELPLSIEDEGGADQDTETSGSPPFSTETENRRVPLLISSTHLASKPDPRHEQVLLTGTLTDARNVYTTRGSRRVR